MGYIIAAMAGALIASLFIGMVMLGAKADQTSEMFADWDWKKDDNVG